MQLHVDVYIWCAFAVFIYFKLFSDFVMQVRGRGKTGLVDYPEDMKPGSRMQKADVSVPAETSLFRATALFRNDLENIVPVAVLALAGALVQIDARIYLILLCLYAFARIMHAFCLMRAVQPFRTVSFLFGQFCAVVLAVLTVVRLVSIFETF